MTSESEVKLQEVFRSVLRLPPERDLTRASRLSVETWDSLAHVSLMLAIESEFGVTIDLTDQLELATYNSIRLYIEQRIA